MQQPQPRTSSLHRPKRTVSIIGTGSYAPEKILTNADLEKLVDTSDEWITTRTGMKERHIAAEHEATSDLATKAAQAALKNAGVEAGEIDMILLATITPDMAFPNTACLVQKQIGAKRAVCMDLSAACTGFLYGMEIGKQFIANHVCETILVIAADKLSGIVDWSDRNTCVLFGDAAAAVVLRHRPGSHGLIHTVMGSNGEYAGILHQPGGGSRMPITKENIDAKHHTMKMNGKEVYKQAVTAMVGTSQEALKAAGLKIEEIACLFPHQANLRIIEAVGSRLGIPAEKVFVNLHRYGNTSAVTIPLALDEAHRTGRIKKGDYLLLTTFGGGLTWASSVLQWG